VDGDLEGVGHGCLRVIVWVGWEGMLLGWGSG